MASIIKSSNKTIHDALRVLARDIQSEDGVANTAIAEAADRISELGTENDRLHLENAALRAAIAESEEFARKNGETLATKVKELLAENAALRKQAVEVLMIGRAWIAVWFDHLSPASVEQFIALEKQILKQRKEAQP